MTTDGSTKNADVLLAQMRQANERGSKDEVLELFSIMADFLKSSRGLRVEATSLAVRALVAKNDRQSARKLLQSIGTGEYAQAIHYAFLAQAFLAVRNYKEAARACEQADLLVQKEKIQLA